MSYMSEEPTPSPPPYAAKRSHPAKGRQARRGAICRCFGYMRDFFAQNDQLPPMAHIAANFGWSSDQSALEHVESLMRHGLIERNACGKLRFSREGAQK